MITVRRGRRRDPELELPFRSFGRAKPAYDALVRAYAGDRTVTVTMQDNRPPPRPWG